MRYGWNRSLESRIRKLEQKQAALNRKYVHKPIKVWMGPLRRLPQDYKGERHSVIVERFGLDDQGRELCRYEERPGPKPEGPTEGLDPNFHHMLLQSVAPYPDLE
jgi:hypothetical protein